MAKKSKKSHDMLVPRDHAEASFTEMVPFRSSKIDLKKSPLMIFALLTAIVAPMLYITMGLDGQTTDIATKRSLFAWQVNLSVFYILASIMVAIYLYARPRRPIWVYSIAFVATVFITASPIFGILAIPFRNTIPGIMEMGLTAPTFPARFFGMLMIAGLTEEWTKAVPTLIAFWLTLQVMQGKTKDKGFVSQFRLRGPLDGVLMGMFSGAGFIMAETAFEYVPRTLEQTIQQTGSWDAGVAQALTLMVPRVVQSFAGHIGWQALVGYGIGLAVIRPKSKWKLIFGAWAVASVAHALWNSAGMIHEYAYYLVAIATVIMAIGCLLKARQIDLLEGGEATPDTFGSIIVEPAKERSAPTAAPLPPAPRASAAPPVLVPLASAATGAIALDIDGLQIPLRANGVIDLSAEPALGGRGVGVTGMVVPHPTRADVLGLRNTGSVGWTARLRDGSQQQIDRDQNIRLAPGVSIAFGDGLFGAVVAL
ncbi:PrsW family intramembrane metalloprotease [Sphingomonas sp. M1-B02]|uniref:PrsW family intramembrane metalloprotease n=1 Tax=Sphingomonas sp. M1-B02 TaxID=3114300 RepID=UPI00223FC08C|nr:PrsW family intramembrane metalloprotease [Sphingomonas sp. S6-11]UZK67840.1 PrsW family intramembrane metalloprotease [Sphingomonas sp. S6-11]